MTMSLYIRGDYFLKSYTVLKTAVVYDKYNPNICLGKACFTEQSYMIGISSVYVRYMHVIYLQLDSSSSAGCFLAFLVFQARRAASDLDFVRIRSVLATDRLPTRGWGLPKLHS